MAASLYEMQGGAYVKLEDSSGVGTYPWPGSSGLQCSIKTQFKLTSAGDYRVVATAVRFLGPQLLVGVYDD